MRKLIVYPNYSMGGVTSVIRGRAAAEPDTQFDILFLRERGGAGAFRDFSNVDVRVCAENRVEDYLKYWLGYREYDEISVLSHPDIANIVATITEAPVIYEIHTSDLKVISNEIGRLDLKEMSAVVAPSEPMAEQISALLPRRFQARVEVRSNLVDCSVYSPGGGAQFDFPAVVEGKASIPLVWVGRFDEGKGYRYFLRLLAQLPPTYVGVLAVSLEDDPQRTAKFFAEAAAMGVAGRVRVFSNLSRESMAELYRGAREDNGWLVSTSLMESFGYAVAEALTCGLRVAAFELPALQNFMGWGVLRLVDIGSVDSLAFAIQSEDFEDA